MTKRQRDFFEVSWEQTLPMCNPILLFQREQYELLWWALPHTSFAVHNCLLEMAKVGFSGGKGGRMKAKAPSHIPEHRCWAESWRRWRFRTSCVPLSCSTFSSSSTRACLCLLLCLSDSTWTFSHSLTDMTVDERKAVSHSVPCEGRTCTFILPHSALETILFER